MQRGRKTGDHWLYIKIQHCAGRNLADCPSVPSRTMELSRMLKIFVQIASALMHVHSCRLIDRDLKPANIVVADVEREMRLLGGFGLLRDVANASSLNVATSLDYFLTRACFQWSAEHSFVNVDVVEHVGKQCRTYWCCRVILHKPKTSRRKSGSSRGTCTSTNDPFELCHDCFGRQWRGTSISVMPETASFLLISAAQRYVPEIRHAQYVVQSRPERTANSQC